MKCIRNSLAYTQMLPVMLKDPTNIQIDAKIFKKKENTST